MAAATRSWVDIPEECFACILSHLPCVLDRAVFSSVCTKWRSTSQQHPPLESPWVIRPSAATETSFYCNAGDTHYWPRIPGDARGSRFCGSFPGGWVVAILPESRGHTLINLFTRVRVGLPLRLFVPGTGGGSMCPVFIHAVALSAAPTTIRQHYVAAIGSSQSPSPIAFWRPGMKFWMPPRPTTWPSDKSWRNMLPKGSIEDVTYYAGTPHEGFFVLTGNEDLLVYSPATNNRYGELTMSVENYIFPVHRVNKPRQGQLISRYLVQSRGQLLMVVRFYSVDQKSTVWFRVFTLERMRMRGVVGSRKYSDTAASLFWTWKTTREEALRGRLLYLGRGCSMAVDLHNACAPCIYFLDDTASFHGLKSVAQLQAPYPCVDTGRFFFSEACDGVPTGPPSPIWPNPLSDCSPWIWFFPGDKTFR